MSRYRYEKITRGKYVVSLRECGTILGEISAQYYQSDKALGWDAMTVNDENLRLWNACTREDAACALERAMLRG